jgi:hypothetical protein
LVGAALFRRSTKKGGPKAARVEELAGDSVYPATGNAGGSARFPAAVAGICRGIQRTARALARASYSTSVPLRVSTRPLSRYTSVARRRAPSESGGAETPRAVRAVNLREAKQRGPGGRPRQTEQPRGGILVPLWRICPGGRRHCPVASLRHGGERADAPLRRMRSTG